MKIYDYKGRKNICGNLIKEYRIKKRISQSQLAAFLQDEGIQLERDSISRIESGKRLLSDYELLFIIKVLRIPIQDIIDIIQNL